jgi:hypothetical protein
MFQQYVSYIMATSFSGGRQAYHQHGVGSLSALLIAKRVHSTRSRK